MSPEGRQVKMMGRQSRERVLTFFKHDMMPIVQNARSGCLVRFSTLPTLILFYHIINQLSTLHRLSTNLYFAELTMHENLGLNFLCPGSYNGLLRCCVHKNTQTTHFQEDKLMKRDLYVWTVNKLSTKLLNLGQIIDFLSKTQKIGHPALFKSVSFPIVTCLQRCASWRVCQHPFVGGVNGKQKAVERVFASVMRQQEVKINCPVSVTGVSILRYLGRNLLFLADFIKKLGPFYKKTQFWHSLRTQKPKGQKMLITTKCKVKRLVPQLLKWLL